MKTQLNHSNSGRAAETNYGRIAPMIHGIPVKTSPGRPISWLSSYDEEWATFVNEHSIHKTRPGLHNEEPELLPRVWNCPHP